MASYGGSPWVWSAAHQDFYYATVDKFGNLTYHWYKHIEKATTDGSAFSVEDSHHGRPEAGERLKSDPTPRMPEPVPEEVRVQLYDLIPGDPERGWYESLDSSYRMRTGAEAYSFFKVGKVFAMLHTQAASETALQTSDSITVVRYGEHAFSQIRRFVVVEVRRGFVYACPITTYNGRGTTKPGCIPTEHSAVYLRGQKPTLMPGEQLVKSPIYIIPADPGVHFSSASRLHYSKVYPVEMNVKVKDIGDVDPADMGNLLLYYREEKLI